MNTFSDILDITQAALEVAKDIQANPSARDQKIAVLITHLHHLKSMINENQAVAAQRANELETWLAENTIPIDKSDYHKLSEVGGGEG